jgi:hypothetical protein
MKVEFEGQIIEFPDDASPIEIEESMNSLFPASKAASTIGQREEYRWDKGMALIDNASVWKLAREGKITKEQALGRIADRNARFTPENDERFAADNVPERMLGASTQLSPYMLESAANGLLYGESAAAGTLPRGDCNRAGR